MRRDNFQKIVVSSGVCCLLTDGESFQSLSKNTDSLIQRKQLVGKKYRWIFSVSFPLFNLPLYFTVSYTFDIVARQTASGWVDIAVAVFFLKLEKYFLIFPSFRISGLNDLTLNHNLRWSHGSVPLHSGHPSRVWGACCLPCWLVPAPALSQVSGACLHPAPWQRPQPWHRTQECTQPARAWRCAWAKEISGTQSMGVTLPGSGFGWRLCCFPQCFCLWKCYTETTKVTHFILKKRLQSHAEKKMLCNFWTHNVPRSVGTFATSCTSANEPSWSRFVFASLVQIIWPWIIECWLYK